MSTELINRISIKKDGVYLSSHSSNDTAPFRSFRCKSLSEVYAAEGRLGLDREIIRMLHECAQLRGSHESLDRYRFAMESEDGRRIRGKYQDQIDERFAELPEEDRQTVWYKPTAKAKEFNAFQEATRTQMYSELAELCARYDPDSCRFHNRIPRDCTKLEVTFLTDTAAGKAGTAMVARRTSGAWIGELNGKRWRLFPDHLHNARLCSIRVLA